MNEAKENNELFTFAGTNSGINGPVRFSTAAEYERDVQAGCSPFAGGQNVSWVDRAGRRTELYEAKDCQPASSRDKAFKEARGVVDGIIRGRADGTSTRKTGQEPDQHRR